MTTKVISQASGDMWTMFQGDCCEVIAGIPDDSIDFGIHSPPFANLYIYSDSMADMGNAANSDEFFEHYSYLIRELFRTTVPGRLCAVHCKDLPLYFNRDGAAGLDDFPGDIIRAFSACGWTYHSRVTIWKDPVIEMQRTKNNGLLHKTLCRDSSQVRQGMADYLLVFRKITGDSLMSDKPVTRNPPSDFTGDEKAWRRSHCFSRYVGSKEGIRIGSYCVGGMPDTYGENGNNSEGFGLEVWQRYASPVWFDISQTRVLNYRLARDEQDEKHICLASESLVLTKDGYRQIQDISIGDMVLTHLGRWRPVIAKQCTGLKPVVKLEAQGVPGLRLTPDHKLLVRNAGTHSHPRLKIRTVRPGWFAASETKGQYVNLKLPPVEPTLYPKDDWRIVGRWLADGHWCVRDKNLFISCGKAKRDSLVKMLGNRCGAVNEVRTGFQIAVKDRGGMLRKLIRRFGRGADGKRIPIEALSLDQEHAKALLDGYLSGDGHYTKQYERNTASSVSRPMLLGLAMIAQRVHGVAASVYAGRKPGTTVIEGRTVNTLQEWIMSIPPRNVSAMILDDGAWKKVRKITPDGSSYVWSIQVEEDASFTAEGCIVKNCPLQLDVIERSVELWTNPDDVVLSPFAGVGSEGVGSICCGRRFIGIELKDSYFAQAVGNLKVAESKWKTDSKLLF